MQPQNATNIFHGYIIISTKFNGPPTSRTTILFINHEMITLSINIHVSCPDYIRHLNMPLVNGQNYS